MPTWAQGRTAQEVLTLATQMAAALPTAAPTPPPAPQFTAPSGQVPSLSLADEFLLRPEEAAKKVADQVFADRMAPALQGVQNIATQFASVQRHLAAQQFAPEFRKYGPEIDSLMASVPAEARTLENFEKVVTFIRGKYRDDPDLRSGGLAPQAGLGARSGGSGGIGTPTASGLDFEKLPQGLGKVAERVGLTEAMVLDYCKATHTTPQAWMEAALNDKVVTSVAPFSFQIKPEHLGVKRAFDA